MSVKKHGGAFVQLDKDDPYMQHLEVIVYGYCRSRLRKYHLQFPAEMMRLCYLWFHPNTIALRITTLTGKRIRIDVVPTDYCSQIKQNIQEKVGIQLVQQRLTLPHLGKPLQDSLRICDYNLHNNDDVFLRIPFAGAPPPQNAAPLPGAANAQPQTQANNAQLDTDVDMQMAIAMSLSMQSQPPPPSNTNQQPWTCQVCTLINDNPLATHCSVCQTQRT